ncbi:MAG: hypothetical protein D6826_06380 [Alphaproteobacteria bacterium]|nr:MAG: hypothetical protein D6826_06380 [Alphaproteobacteria bacterium]
MMNIRRSTMAALAGLGALTLLGTSALAAGDSALDGNPSQLQLAHMGQSPGMGQPPGGQSMPDGQWMRQPCLMGPMGRSLPQGPGMTGPGMMGPQGMMGMMGPGMMGPMGQGWGGRSAPGMGMAPDGDDSAFGSRVVPPRDLSTDAGTVSEIDVATGTPGRTFTVGGLLHGLDISGNGSHLFVSARERNELVAINLHTLNVRKIPLVPAPYHAAVVGGSAKVYVSSADEPKIWVLDQDSLAIRGEIPIRGVGHQMAVVQP